MKRTILLTALLLFLPSICFADEIIKGRYCYTYGDNESLKEARELTRTLAIRDAIESYGVFVESISTVKDFKLSDDLLQIISAGYLKNIKVLEHTEKGRTICDTIQASINPKQLNELVISTTTKKTDRDRKREIDSEEQEEIYSFCLDFIRCLKYIQESGVYEYDTEKWVQEIGTDRFEGDVHIDEFKLFCALFFGFSKDRLIAAKNKIERWKNSKDIYIRSLAEEFSKRYIDKLVLAHDDMFELCFDCIKREWPDDYDAGLLGDYVFIFYTRLWTGKMMMKYYFTPHELIFFMSDRATYKSSRDLMEAIKKNKPIYFALSEKHLESIIRYIDKTFEWELNEYKTLRKQQNKAKPISDIIKGVFIIKELITKRG